MRTAIVIGVFIAAVAAFLVWYPSSEEVVPVTPLGATAADRTSTAPSTALTYANARFHFSFTRPENVTIAEFDEPGPAQTIVIQANDQSRGFQIYVLPYGEKTISEARFSMDAPSGVRKNETQAMLGGTEAVAFDSSDPILGDTREVWVIRGGYLYEITAKKGDEVWLSSILTTWRFL